MKGNLRSAGPIQQIAKEAEKMGIFRRLMDFIGGGGQKSEGFELSDNVKREILAGMGMDPTDDLGFKQGESGEKPQKEESDQ